MEVLIACIAMKVQALSFIKNDMTSLTDGPLNAWIEVEEFFTFSCFDLDWIISRNVLAENRPTKVNLIENSLINAKYLFRKGDDKKEQKNVFVCKLKFSGRC